MTEANINVTNDFKICEEKMAVFLLNQNLDEGVLGEEEIFILVHVEERKIKITTPIISQTFHIGNMQDLIWMLPDDKVPIFARFSVYKTRY